MATVGELLKKARLEKKIELLDVERETKIRSDFIRALEEGQYNKLPSATYARGFLRNYAQFLGLDTSTIMALFRREFEGESTAKLLPKGLSEFPAKRIRVTSIALLLLALFIAFLFYFFFQYRGFLGSPSLSVDTPHEQQVIENDLVKVTGKTDPDATLVINNRTVLLASDGSFEEEIAVFKGDFTITVTARNRAGVESEVIRTIKVKTP